MKEKQIAKPKILKRNPELKKLIIFCKVQNINVDLRISSLEEICRLYHAHQQTGKQHIQTVNFLTCAIIPDPNVITPSFIFKALKFNPDFYQRYEMLINVTKSFRERAYRTTQIKAQIPPEQQNDAYKSVNEYNKKIQDKSNAENYKAANLITPYIIRRQPKNGERLQCASSNNTKVLIKPCYLPKDLPNEWDNVPVKNLTLQIDDDLDSVEIWFKMPNTDEFKNHRKRLFLKVYTENNMAFVVETTTTQTSGILKVYAELPSGIMCDGTKWSLSYRESVPWNC